MGKILGIPVYEETNSGKYGFCVKIGKLRKWSNRERDHEPLDFWVSYFRTNPDKFGHAQGLTLCVRERERAEKGSGSNDLWVIPLRNDQLTK